MELKIDAPWYRRANRRSSGHCGFVIGHLDIRPLATVGLKSQEATARIDSAEHCGQVAQTAALRFDALRLGEDFLTVKS